MSYLRESLACFNHELPKASAVMIGCAAESMILELRDAIVSRLQAIRQPIPKGLSDWRFKAIYDATSKVLDQHSAGMPVQVRESLSSLMPAFLHQIRVSRNDAGHPSGVDPVTFESVHASLLIFPELASWLDGLKTWVAADLK